MLQRGDAWSFIGTMTAAFREGLSTQQRPPSGSRCQASHTPRRLPAVLRVAGPSSFVLKIILVPSFSLLTSRYLPSVTQNLFFLLVVNGVFAVGCRSLRASRARSQRCACIMKLERCLP